MMKKLKTTNAPSIIFTIKEISVNARVTLFNIAHLQKLKRTISQGLLVQMGGVCRRTINNALNELEEKGYIVRATKLLNGKGKETKYTIIWNKITQHAKESDWYEEKVVETPQPVETPVEEEFDDFSEELYQLLESDDMNTIKNILERSVDYSQFNKDEYEVYYNRGNRKITEICNNYHLSDKDICDLEKYCQEYSISYLNRVADRMMCAAS